ncbi:hypothetical protein Cgig2_010415 [Carnegiea gigantea]|uniref:Uncharacterized protein n=1 Tax=Carnegiea gigantea TaxID=171969 RepID=A0A9Q1GT70_9CARY|nr:hypothetical protein Cgig2_010415 [Carnegiea gigantea]
MFLAKKIGALPRKIHYPQPHFFRSRVDFARPDLQLNCFYLFLLRCCFFFARPDISLFEFGHPFWCFDLPNNSLPFSTDFAHREVSNLLLHLSLMERKGYLLPTLGVGVGVGVGLGIASGQTVGVGSNSAWIASPLNRLSLNYPNRLLMAGRSRLRNSLLIFVSVGNLIPKLGFIKSYWRLVVPNLISRKHTNSAATSMLYLYLHI